MSRSTRLASLLTIAVTLACSDGSPDRGGTLSFSYSGSVATGSFASAGAMPTRTNLLIQSSAFAVLSGTGATAHIVLVAVQPGADSSYRQLTLDVDRNTAGTATFSAGSCAGCATLLFTPNGTLKGSAPPSILCALTSGTIVFDGVNSRVTGTFSGSGTCASEGISTPFTVTGGTFDVQLETTPPQP